MIRAATPEHTDAVVSLAVSSGLFPADATEAPAKMMRDFFAGNADAGHFCLIDETDEPLGVAYCAPAPVTDGTWYLTMIAVRADQQGQGRGSALLRAVEEQLRRRGQRILLVETAGVPAFARTRAFYAKCGYEEEARIREYYAPGEDMVVFRKAL